MLSHGPILVLLKHVVGVSSKRKFGGQWRVSIHIGKRSSGEEAVISHWDSILHITIRSNLTDQIQSPCYKDISKMPH